MNKVKKKLYSGDSSDEEDVIYSKEKIRTNANKLNQNDLQSRNFLSSFILGEVSHSILEDSKVLEVYIKRKNGLVAVIDNENLSKNNDSIGQFLFGKHLINKHTDSGSTEWLKEFYDDNIENISQVKTKLNDLKGLKTIKEKFTNLEAQNLDYNNVQQIFSQYFPKSDVKNAFMKYFKTTSSTFTEIQKSINDNTLTPDILSLIGKKALKSKNIKEFFQKEFLQKYFENDLLPISKQNIYTKRFFIHKTLESDVTDENLKNMCLNYVDDLLRLLELGSKKLKLEEKSLNIETAFVTKLYIDLMNNENNKKINNTLLKQSQQFYSSEDDYTQEFFANFKLTHRIIRSKTKEVGIENYRNASIRRNIEVSGFTINADIEISKKGTRTDYRKLPLKRQSSTYSGLVKDELDIKPGTNQLLKSILQKIIKGKKVSDEEIVNLLVDSRDKEFLYKFVDLLFNCEPERNASAFLTNAMFFDLLGEGKYTIKNLPDKLPMAIEGAVSGARALLDSLGGEYGELSPYLTKRQYYDFGEGNQEKAQELAARDTAIFIDWLCSKKILQADENIKFGDKINEYETLEELIKSLREILDSSRQQQKSIWEAKFNAVNQKLLSLFKEDTNTANKIFKALHDLVHDWYGINLEYLSEASLFKASTDLQPSPGKPNLGGPKPLSGGYQIQSSQDTTETADSLFTKGYGFHVKHQYEQAVTYYDRAIRENPTYSAAHHNKSLCLFKLKRYEESIKCFDTVIENKYGNQSDNYYNKGLALYNLCEENIDQNRKKENYKTAIRCFEKSVEMIDNKEHILYAEDSKRLCILRLNDISEELITKYDNNPNQQIVLSGINKENEKDIDYVNSYFGKYTLDGLENILDLRLKDLNLDNDIKILPSTFTDQNNNIADTFTEIYHIKQKIILVLLSLFSKHAVGLIFIKNEDNSIAEVNYIDSLNKAMPQGLKQLMVGYFGVKTKLQEMPVEEQKYANCGPEVIENFILYLTGKRMSQEKAIELHSKLVENALLNIKSSDHLLFKERTECYTHIKDYHLEQNKYLDNQLYNFDYDNLQLEVAGGIHSIFSDHTIN